MKPQSIQSSQAKTLGKLEDNVCLGQYRVEGESWVRGWFE